MTHRHRARLAVELGALKPHWEAHCRREGVSASDAVRQLVADALSATCGDDTGSSYPASLDDVGPRQRIEIRLTRGELDALRVLADAAGLSVNRWIVAMIRVHLTGEPQLGEHEVAVLAESNYQLASIGRNLNQVARVLNESPTKAGQPASMAVESLKIAVHSHLERVVEVLRANLDRWSR